MKKTKCFITPGQMTLLTYDYHTLVDDSVRGAFREAFAVKTREELDGRHSALLLYKDFYEKVADRFYDKE